MTTATETKPDTGQESVTDADLHRASTINQRINIALNVEVWKDLPPEQCEILTWFHQYILDNRLSGEEAGKAIGYSYTTVWHVLRNDYKGNIEDVIAAISSFRKLSIERGQVQSHEFVETSVSKLVHGALNFALANNTIITIEGESRTGKTVSATAWRNANNHGRSVYIIAPAYGGTKALLRAIASAIGSNRESNAGQMHDAAIRAFNRHRILIVDEAHRLLPSDRSRSNATNLEIIRDLHDRTGCAVALIATKRFNSELARTEYMHEQLQGRIELPVRIPRKIKRADVEKIVLQFMAEPSATTIEAAEKIANDRGRLGILTGILRVASRMAGGKRRAVTNELFAKAMKLREQMMGETIYAAE